MTQELVMAISVRWDKLAKVELIESLLQGNSSVQVLYLGPLNVLIQELSEQKEMDWERVLLMTYQSFLRECKSLDLRKYFVILDEFSFCLEWGRRSGSFLYEAIHELSLYPVTCLALARKSHRKSHLSWIELGFNVRELDYGDVEIPLHIISSPWTFLTHALRSLLDRQSVGIYCHSSRASWFWRKSLGAFPIFKLEVFSRELIYKDLLKEREDRAESFFLSSPLKHIELSFLLSRTCGRRFPKKIYVYQPYAVGIGKREKNVLKSVACKQKLRDFSSPKDLFKSATWWAHSC